MMLGEKDQHLFYCLKCCSAQNTLFHPQAKAGGKHTVLIGLKFCFSAAQTSEPHDVMFADGSVQIFVNTQKYMTDV